jgi:hypothetical protein
MFPALLNTITPFLSVILMHILTFIVRSYFHKYLYNRILLVIFRLISYILLHYIVFTVYGLQHDTRALRSEICACTLGCVNRQCKCHRFERPCKAQCLCWGSGCQNPHQVIWHYYFLLLLTYNYKIQRDLFICSTAYSQYL